MSPELARRAGRLKEATMNVLGKWGAYILAVQVLFGGGAYALAWASGFDDAFAIKLAVFAAGVVAAAVVLFTIARSDTVGTAVAMSSIVGMLVILCALSYAPIVGSVLGFLCLALAMLAARLAQEKLHTGEETLLQLSLAAFPVIGGFAYIIDRLSNARITKS